MEKNNAEEKKTENKDEWYDEVYFDSDQDSEEDYAGGIGLMGQQKKEPSKYNLTNY